ncbi:MAG: hypothetical protein HDS32_00555 [Bacteroides sp.]|nr:hypothetical protein [Bacteroides sp.]
MKNRAKIGWSLVYWSVLCLLPIPLAALLPTDICSYIYMLLWVISVSIFGRLLSLTSLNKQESLQTPITFGCFLLVIFYGLKIILLAFQLLGYGNLTAIQYIGFINSVILWIGLIMFFGDRIFKGVGIILTLSGFAMSIPSFLTYASGIGIIEWERFAFLTPIFSLLYLIGFITSIIMCIRWIKKSSL